MSEQRINVAQRVDQLLERVANLKRASDLKPTRFDAAGERHATEVARRDQENNRG